MRVVCKSTPRSSLRTRGPSRDLIFSARARGRPPNVQPFLLVTVNSASLELGTLDVLLLKYYARWAFPSTKQLLFPSRLKPGTSKHCLPPSSLRRVLPFVFAPLPLLPLRHCCLMYLRQFLKTQPIAKFQNAFRREIFSVPSYPNVKTFIVSLASLALRRRSVQKLKKRHLPQIHTSTPGTLSH